MRTLPGPIFPLLVHGLFRYRQFFKTLSSTIRILLLRRLLPLLLIPAIWWPPASPAADESSPHGADSITPGLVAARLKIWKSPALDAGLQKSVVPLAEEAASLLDQAGQAKVQTTRFQDQTKSLPVRAAEIRAQADKPQSLPSKFQPPPKGADMDDLEVASTSLHAAVEDARRDTATARDLSQQSSARRKDLSSAVSSLNTRLLQLRTDSLSPTAGEAAELTEARGLAHQAGIASAQAQLDAAEAEVAWLDASDAVSWPALRLASATRTQNALENAETALNQRIAQARSQSAASGVENAARNEAAAPAALQPILKEVTEDANLNRHVVEQLIPEAEVRLRAADALTRKWLDTSLSTREKIRRLGPSGVVGVELRQQRQSIPSLASLHVEAAKRQETLNSVETTRLFLEDKIALLASAPDYSDNQAAAAEKSLRGGLGILQQSYDRYYNTLVRLEESSQQLQAVVSAHLDFIHENILWIPSSIPAGQESRQSLSASFPWLWTGLTGSQLAISWWEGVARYPFVSGVALVFLVFLYLARHKGRNRLSALARLAAQPGSGFGATAAAGLWTVVIALPWPALLWLLARPWQDSTLSDSFALALGASLQRTAVVLLGLELARQPLCSAGLAEVHFEWPAHIIKQLRWQFRRFSAVVLPCVLLGSIFRLSEEPRHDPAERGFLVVALLAAAWWVRQFWKTGNSQRKQIPGRTARLIWMVVRGLSILIPLALIMLSLRGYLYTAEMLTERLALSLLAGVAFLLAKAFFYHWYALQRRGLRAERARVLREAREASRSASSTAAATSSNIPPGTGTSELPLEPPAPVISGSDIDEAGQEMRGLVDIIAFIAAAAAAWAIWADVLPAAKTLANRPLDNFAALITDKSPSAGSSSSAATGSAASSSPLSNLVNSAGTGPGSAATSSDRPQPTTWLGVIMACAVAALTLVAARRIPGALQFVLTSQLSLDAGARFALSTITRYVIISVGVVVSLGLLGITWSSVQWLAAALTVGLGFGLQEIFANFFSGLIILAERPIRPGDVITIDNITGSVARIQIRSTTIRCPDGKDYIIPNKDLITGKLLNWTRTDNATRQDIAVGVAYGTDVPAVLKLLAKIAAAHPAVLKEPAPMVTFESFGESSLNLMLRFHVGSLEQRMPTRTDLYCAIAAEFTTANLEIPFPQRDLHIRTGGTASTV